MTKIQELEKQKNNAYWERNQLVAALSRIFPSYLAKHDPNDKDWESDWRTIVVIEVPVNELAIFGDKINNLRMDDDRKRIVMKQLTWHIHDSEVPMFDHLFYQNYEWDGHTTEEKYKRLRLADMKVLTHIIRDRYERS